MLPLSAFSMAHLHLYAERLAAFLKEQGEAGDGVALLGVRGGWGKGGIWCLFFWVSVVHACVIFFCPATQCENNSLTYHMSIIK
jgi:hypothetical protein